MKVYDDKKPACFSCQAIEDSEVLIINTQVIKVLETQPDGQQLLRLVVEDLAFGLRDCEASQRHRLLSLYRDSPEQRYCDFLLTFSVVHIDRIENGKIVEHWGQGDVRALMQQLGIVFVSSPKLILCALKNILFKIGN